MNYKGDVKVNIPQNLYESISLSINDSPIENLMISLTQMESRCSECSKPFNIDDEVITMINATVTSHDRIKLSSNDLFIIHKSCLEEFVSSHLNREMQKDDLVE